MKVLLVSVLVLVAVQTSTACLASQTTVSGTHAPTGTICSGDLIFEDNFDRLDFQKWQHESTLGGGGNWEFQWYLNNRSNSYVENSVLFITPTLTSDAIGEAGLTSANINIHGGTPVDGCTNPQFYGCERQGTASNVINPIRSARLRTFESFSFKYGRVEINAKTPSGDWLWPALWFMPRHNAYGTWPSSGEIDLMETRGNLNLVQGSVNIGAEQVSSTLHFGPYPGLNAYSTTYNARNSAAGNGWNNAFHRYGMTWSPTGIAFSVDGVVYNTVSVNSGFWDRGGFASKAPGTQNPWRYGSAMAPFDQEFYLLINLAVGGTGFFPDDATNPGGKPWNNNSPTAATDFWNGRNQWLNTWNLNGDKRASFQIDYVRIWAL